MVGKEAKILVTPTIELTMAKTRTNHLAVGFVCNNIKVPSCVRSELASLFMALIVDGDFFSKKRFLRSSFKKFNTGRWF